MGVAPAQRASALGHLRMVAKAWKPLGPWVSPVRACSAAQVVLLWCGHPCLPRWGLCLRLWCRWRWSRLWSRCHIRCRGLRHGSAGNLKRMLSWELPRQPKGARLAACLSLSFQQIQQHCQHVHVLQLIAFLWSMASPSHQTSLHCQTFHACHVEHVERLPLMKLLMK